MMNLSHGQNNILSELNQYQSMTLTRSFNDAPLITVYIILVYLILIIHDKYTTLLLMTLRPTRPECEVLKLDKLLVLLHHTVHLSYLKGIRIDSKTHISQVCIHETSE